jgi:primosomal protein N' (replication factor Y)
MSFAQVAVPAPLFPLDRVFDFQIPGAGFEDLGPGSWVEIPLGRQKTWGIVTSIQPTSSVEPNKLKSLYGLKLPEKLWQPKRLEWLHWMSRHYAYPLGEVLESAIPGPLRSAKTQNLQKYYAQTQSQEAVFHTKESRHTLNSFQEEAVQSICNSNEPVLLWGLTGSGKTEVYLESLRRILDADPEATALVLVPEISLTPQLITRFEERFPNQVAHFHSGLSDSVLRQNWLSVLCQKKRIALGARSAIFAPLKNLRLIVVDEEHDASYKQEERLRYHARDAALALAAMCRSKIVLGSATPSAESWWAAKNQKYKLAKLEQRAVVGSKLPTIEIVDLSPPPQHSIPTENLNTDPDPRDLLGNTKVFFTDPLMRELSQCLESKKQAILFLNRRGLGSQSLCSQCGSVQFCLNCSVTLTPHRKGALCHYCGFERKGADPCTACKGHHSTFEIGLGTEQVQEALKILFPKAVSLRMDRDTVENSEDLESVLESFRSGQADILIGTQMVAKGHDFPNVALVGVLFAELGLAVPDFRANERNFQLLLQVAGRAGRSQLPGRVIVQTFQPAAASIAALKTQTGLDDYSKFLDEELDNRQALSYPPFGRLALLRADSNSENSVIEAARVLAHGLRKIQRPGLIVLGPTPSPIYKIRGRYRYQILLKSRTASDLQTALHWIQQRWADEKLESQMKTRLILDVDPVQML